MTAIFRPLDDGQLTDWIVESTEQLAEVAAVVGSREPVPACPGWTMRQLLAHVISGLSGWYTHNITHGDRPTDLLTAWDAQPELPRTNAERLCYLRDVTADFVALVGSVDLDAPCYVFQDRRSARGWLLRAATECAIHLQDAQEILGDPEPFGPERAATSLDETFRYMWRGALLIHGDLGAEHVPEVPITVRATDLGLEWRVTKEPGGFVVEVLESGDQPGGLCVAGAHADLVRWLWGRSQRGELDLVGDRSSIDAWNLSSRT